MDRFEIDGTGFFFAGRFVHPPQFRMDFHVHDFYEITLVVGGSGRYEVLCETGVTTIPVHKGTLIAWNGKVPHRAVDDEGAPLEQEILLFDDAYIAGIQVKHVFRQLLEGTGCLVRECGAMEREIEPLFQSILSEQRHQSFGRDDMLHSLLTRLLVGLIRLEPFSVSSMLRYDDQRINRAIEYGLRNYTAEIGLAEIAGVACLSPRRFTELFHDTTGYSWKQFIHHVRTANAKWLLQHTDSSITEIAHAVGYSTGSLFSRWFSRLCGKSPLEYRQHGSGVVMPQADPGDDGVKDLIRV